MWISRSKGDADGWGGIIYWRGVGRNWFRDGNFLAMSVDVFEILNWRWDRWLRSVYQRHWWRISRSICRQRHRQWKSNRNMWKEILNRLKEGDIGRHKILSGKGIITPVFFLSSRIPNKDTFGRSRRQVLNIISTTKNKRSHGEDILVRIETREWNFFIKNRGGHLINQMIST